MTGLETEETKALREAEADQHSDSTGTTAQEETISREEILPPYIFRPTVLFTQ